MNMFELTKLIAYSNIAICALLIILIVVILLKNDNQKTNDEIYSVKRVLQDIYNKLDKK